MSRENFEYDGLVLGECETYEITIAEGQTVKRGDLLIASGDTFALDTAGATTGKVYCIATEDVDATGGAASSVGYFSGRFNSEKVTEQKAESNKYFLAAQGIFLVNVR